MRTFTEIETEIKEVRSKSIYNYEYKYWRGDENSMSVDEVMNHKYGSDREGYEQYKNDSWVLPNGDLSLYGQIDCSHSGVTSLRTITDRHSEKVIGYITETKKSFSPHRDLAEKLFEEIYEWIIVELDVQDKEAFEYYYNQNRQYSMRESVDDILHNVEWLKEMYRDYHEYEEFKEFMDKIIS